MICIPYNLLQEIHPLGHLFSPRTPSPCQCNDIVHVVKDGGTGRLQYLIVFMLPATALLPVITVINAISHTMFEFWNYCNIIYLLKTGDLHHC